VKRSLKIIVSGNVQHHELQEKIQLNATKLRLEGTSEYLDKDKLLIFVAGESEQLDSLIDVIYEGTPKSSIEDVDVDSNTSPKSFRGVFRIISNDNE